MSSNFVFTVSKSKYVGDNKPWLITSSGQAMDDKPRSCLINGIEIPRGRRVLVEEKCEDGLSIATVKKYGEVFRVVLDWDGTTLTEFPDAGYVEWAQENCIKISL